MRPDESLELISVLKGVAEIVKQQHESVRRQLTMVQQTSEREVLAAGSQLAKIFEEMSDHTLRLATLKEDESSGTNEGSFAAVFARFSGQMPALLAVLVAESTTQSQLASGAGKQIREVMEVGSELSGIALWCKVVATNARVEAAHAGEAGRGFAVLADALAAISTDIARATKSVFDSALAVKGMVTRMADAAAGVADEGQSRAATMKVAVAVCQSAYQKAVIGSIEEFEGNAAAIRDRSNTALSHLQFQDRVQQALDHVVAGNARLADGLETLVGELTETGSTRSLAELKASLQELFTTTSSLAVVQDMAGSERSNGDIQFLE